MSRFCQPILRGQVFKTWRITPGTGKIENDGKKARNNRVGERGGKNLYSRNEKVNKGKEVGKASNEI